MSQHVAPCRTISHHLTPFCTTQDHYAPSHTVPRHPTLFGTITLLSAPSSMIPHHAAPLDTIAYIPALYCTIQHHLARFRTILYHPAQFLIIMHHSVQPFMYHSINLPTKPSIHPRINKLTYPQLREMIALPNHQTTNPSSHHHINPVAICYASNDDNHYFRSLELPMCPHTFKYWQMSCLVCGCGQYLN